tara:strand:+ start:45963 stop:46364 length:402 start_codon:yes stop_codon:yes gene_type:complete
MIRNIIAGLPCDFSGQITCKDVGIVNPYLGRKIGTNHMYMGWIMIPKIHVDFKTAEILNRRHAAPLSLPFKIGQKLAYFKFEHKKSRQFPDGNKSSREYLVGNTLRNKGRGVFPNVKGCSELALPCSDRQALP